MKKAYPVRASSSSEVKPGRFHALLLRHYRLAVLLLDIALFPLVYVAAFRLRFGPDFPAWESMFFRQSLPYLLLVRTLAFYYWGVHKGSWRHVGMSDLSALLKAVSASSLLMFGIVSVVPDLRGLPYSVLVLDWLIAVALFGGTRFAVRGLRESYHRRGRESPSGRRALIVGSVDAAERLLREWKHGGGSDFEPIGIVDDDPGRPRLRVHGVATVGTTRELVGLTKRLQPDLLVIAVLTTSGERMRELLNRCRSTGLTVRIMPTDREIRSGMRAGQLREIRTEDFLGREAVSLDMSEVRRQVRGQVVLVTGGAGSIGLELARQVLEQEPARLVLLDQAETPLYFAHLDLRNRSNVDIVPVVGSVSDERRVREVFGVHRPGMVFHAAAYKHVPMMEDNVGEAIRNNVFGTVCVAESAVEFGAQRFVLISTDKAVNPSCVMGATKRIAERAILALPHIQSGATDFRAVRFGNVLGSNGSVIPVFDRQLAERGVLTVTHPEVTRYFMTIPEAVQLVLQAATLVEATGRICMLEMGEPVRIVELAEAIIRNAGLRPYHDVGIEFTGLRPGEKLHEDLVSGMETTVSTSLEKVRIAQIEELDPRYIERHLISLLKAASMGSIDQQLEALVSLVPECVDPLRSLAASHATHGRHGPSVPRWSGGQASRVSPAR